MNIQIGRRFTLYLLFPLFFLTFFSPSFAQQVNDSATLQINFPGLTSVHIDIRVDDGIDDSATGVLIKRANWKSNTTTVEIPRGNYDVIVKKGAGILLVDNVNCLSGNCIVDNIVANLTVDFPGLSGVHSSVHLLDHQDDLATGGQINKKSWQKNQAIIPVLRQIVDLKVRKGGGHIVVDNIDCGSGVCESGDLTAHLIVKFPGLSGVHTSVRVLDNELGQSEGKEVNKKNWQNNQAEIIVLKNEYDVLIKSGASSLVVDNVDCFSGFCTIDDIQSTLTVEFPGMSGVHTSVRQSDDILNSALGEKVTYKNWQTDQAVISLLPGRYDLILRKGGDIFVIDDVDCTASSCLVNDITARMVVDFPGLNSMHTTIYTPDGFADKVSGKEVLNKSWQTDQAVLKVFKKQYDHECSL